MPVTIASGLMFRARLLTCALVVLAPLLAGCDGDEPTIALLVADASDCASRAVDVEQFTDRVEATCDECRVTVYDAEGDAETQRSQARQAEAAQRRRDRRGAGRRRRPGVPDRSATSRSCRSASWCRDRTASSGSTGGEVATQAAPTSRRRATCSSATRSR